MPLVIQGHPGTGKTIIAVHRAGFLVNEDLAAEQRRPVPKVLLLGPTEQYVRHVMRVIRELDPKGHITVKSLPSLLADLAGHRPEVTTTEGAPEDVDGTVADLADRVVKWSRSRPGWRQLSRAAQIQFAYEALRADDPDGNRPPLSEAERTWAATLPAFTKARAHRHYLPLLAAMAMRAGPTPARFDHVVVDEAQDVSELEWEIIRAHNPHGRWTVVGDLHQRRRQDVGDLDWHALAKRLHIYAGTDLFTPEVVERGYRSTQPILDFANRLLPAGARRTASLQTKGETPKVIPAKNATRRDQRAIAEAVRLLDAYPGGTAAIITTDPDHVEKLMLADGWRRAGPPVSGTDWARDSTGHRLAVLTPEAARGVEFDGVVVVEPAFLVRKEEFSGTLYTSLTRANRELVVVHKDSLPAALR
jgi:DNA helicase IV